MFDQFTVYWTKLAGLAKINFIIEHWSTLILIPSARKCICDNKYHGDSHIHIVVIPVLVIQSLQYIVPLPWFEMDDDSTCVVCQKSITPDQSSSKLTKKGCDGINTASVARHSDICASPGLWLAVYIRTKLFKSHIKSYKSRIKSFKSRSKSLSRH